MSRQPTINLPSSSPCLLLLLRSGWVTLLFYQSKASRARSVKRAGSESSQESLSLPPPSPADAHLMGGFPPPSPHPLSSPDPGHTMLVGSTDPMLSMPPPSPLGDCLLPTVLGSPPILVSYLSSTTSLFASPGALFCFHLTLYCSGSLDL